MRRNPVFNARFVHRALVLAAGMLVAATAASQVGYRVDPQGKDELWDVTSKMEPDYSLKALPKPPERVRTATGALWEPPDPQGWLK